ncbi:CMRF35-like molecule 7 [Clarias gariepinus]|uniref:CMRF35-like molecule 7 n=1 Tax=Clarias gariepinus TaxID=13013 RepID=UPI00234DE07E|nr:CMRF35-like molecule 7 [Clarias gariepinus]
MIMKLLLCVICIHLSAQRLVTSEIKVNGYERASVTIECSHRWAEKNRKYFCKDLCKEDKDVVVDSVKTPRVRFHLQDRGNTFTVTITNLSKTDSGTYWCAVDRFFSDTYTKVILTVLEVPLSSPPMSAVTHIYSPPTISYLGNSLTTFRVTYTTVNIATKQSTKESNIIKNTDWRVYLIVSVSVILITSLVGTLVFLILHYMETLVKFRCCPGWRKTSDTECDSFGNQNSIPNNPPPASTGTQSDYENFLNVATSSPNCNIYTVRSV